MAEGISKTEMETLLRTYFGSGGQAFKYAKAAGIVGSSSGTFSLDPESVDDASETMTSRIASSAAESVDKVTKPSFTSGVEKTLEGIEKVYDTTIKAVNATEEVLRKIGQPLREVLFNVKKDFGGYRDATKEMTIGLSQNIREGYDNFAESFAMTGAELAKAGQEKFMVEVDGKMMNLLQIGHEDAMQFQKTFRSVLK